MMKHPSGGGDSGPRPAAPGGDSVPPGDSALLRLAELEGLVAERDQLVTALTVQLEEAAERIDRLQRMGNDRGSRGGGMPREMVEEQRTLNESLQRVADQWEQAQPAAALGRIEMQLAELRDLFAGQVLAPAAESSPAPPERAAPSGAATWEAMKAGLLAGDREQEPLPDEPDGPAEAEEGPPIAAEEIEPPPALDTGAAGVDELRRGVEQRDEYIAWLIRRLRGAELKRQQAEALGGADEAPQAIRARLEELDRVFQEQQRLAEVELSLERARLGREEARLHHLDETLQKELKRAGIDAARPHPEAPADETPKNRRWRRILGIVRSDEPDRG